MKYRKKIVLMNLLQGRNRDADIEDRSVDTVGEGEGRTNRDSSSDIHTLLLLLLLSSFSRVQLCATPQMAE